MRSSKRALCAAVIMAMLLSVGCAEEPEPVLPPPTDASDETTEAPALPLETPEPEETTFPEETPQPSDEPDATAPPESVPPTDVPAESPEPADDAPLIRIEGETVQQDGVWQVICASPEDRISFVWSYAGEAVGFAAEIADSEGVTTALEAPDGMRLEISAADWATGPYTLRIGAVQADGSVVWGELVFAIAQQPGGRPGGSFPGGFGGSRPSGGFAAAGGGGDAPGEEQGFRVTPGEALTDAHASGTKDMRLYGSVALETGDAPMQALELGGASPDVMLDGGAQRFTARIDGERLYLTPVDGGNQWQLSGAALKTLKISGISVLVLAIDDAEIGFDTEMKLSGAVYGELCASGYVSKDYLWTVDASGVTAAVDGAEYRLNADGNLELSGG